MERRIGGAGGGSDKGGGGGGGALVAAVLAGAIAVGGGGAGAATSAGAARDSVTAVQPVHVDTTKAKNSARRGNEGEAWRRMALKRINSTRVRHALRCVVHSYGQVREFFIHTPCRSLDRRLLALADERGDIIVVSIAWVRMPSAASARRFEQLIDTYGTGDVRPLGGELLQLYGIRFTGQHYDSRRRGPLLVIAEAEPVSGRPDAGLLDGAAQVAAYFPPP